MPFIPLKFSMKGMNLHFIILKIVSFFFNYAHVCYVLVPYVNQCYLFVAPISLELNTILSISIQIFARSNKLAK